MAACPFLGTIQCANFNYKALDDLDPSYLKDQCQPLFQEKEASKQIKNMKGPSNQNN